MATYTVELHTLEGLATGGATAVTGFDALDFTRRHNDTADSSITLRDGHPIATPTPYDKVIQVRLNGTPKHAFIIEKRHKTKHHPDGPHKQQTILSGRDLMACTERARISPTLGRDKKPWAPSRVLSFASRQYSPGVDWTTATIIIARQQDRSEHYTGLPDGFPSANTPWIGPSSGTDDQAPTGYCYLIGDFTLDEDTILMGFAATDNAGPLFFDGFLIANISSGEDTTRGFRQATPFTIFATAGDHRIAMKLINEPFGGGDPGFGEGPTVAGNPAAFLFSMFKADSAGRLGDLVLQSDDNWAILEYPDGPPPGVNVGWAGGVLLDEMQTDDELVGYITKSFDDINDTNGNPFDDVESITVNVDDSLLATNKNWAAAGLSDFHMPATGTIWDLYRWGERGLATRSSPAASYLKGTTRLNTNLAKLEFDGEKKGYDCASVTWSGGNFRYPATGGTRMVAVKTNCKTRSEAEARAAQVLASPDIEQVLLDILPIAALDADVPLIGPSEGDTITTHNIDSGTLNEKLVEINAHATDHGLEWKIGMRDVRLDDVDRLQRELQRSAGGVGGGTLPSAPADPPPNFGARISSDEIAFHFQGLLDTGVAEVRKTPKANGNLYGVRLTIPTSEPDGAGGYDALITTADIDVRCWVSDGTTETLAGSGSIVAGESVGYIVIDPMVWLEAGKSEVWPEITAIDVDAHDLVFQPLTI